MVKREYPFRACYAMKILCVFGKNDCGDPFRAKDNRVVVRLTGGLANQMFQYAAARRIAIHNNALLQVDLSWFDQKGNWTPRKYELGIFKLPIAYATQKEVKNLVSFRQNPFFRHLPLFLKSWIFNTNQSHIIEKDFVFDPDILSVKGNIYLDGFWQSYKYFEDVDDTIRSDFYFENDVDSTNRQAAGMITACESVSLHIRRGDYVTLASARACHGLCSLQYYKKAAAIIKDRLNNPVFFVFSDDIPWAKDHLNLDMATVFIDHNGSTPHMDMYLMSLCQHHIIANSSFSWWGAWLGKNIEKTVIGPIKWFEHNKFNTQDLMPKEWIRI